MTIWFWFCSWCVVISISSNDCYSSQLCGGHFLKLCVSYFSHKQDVLEIHVQHNKLWTDFNLINMAPALRISLRQQIHNKNSKPQFPWPGSEFGLAEHWGEGHKHPRCEWRLTDVQQSNNKLWIYCPDQLACDSIKWRWTIPRRQLSRAGFYHFKSGRIISISIYSHHSLNWI